MKSRYSVDLLELIKEWEYTLSGVAELDDVTISWAHGTFTIKTKRNEGGSLEYRGVHHPNDGLCEGEGLCTWCGRTLFD